ncbi:MAG: response regulator, partial [Desulfobacterales bacterium]|nr:response regulator [Desulfobacterales bacterium]
FTFFNNSLSEILGCSPGKLMGTNVRKYTAPESTDRVWKIFTTIYQTGTPVKMIDFEMVKKDGGKVFCELSASLIRDDSGKPVGFRGLARDVTETIKLRNQLQHAQKMEAMGRIASGVAHNFRNILSGISLNTQLIVSMTSDNHPLMEKMEKIVDAVKKGARLVDDLMQFTYKKDKRRFELLDLGKVISEAYDLIRPSFDKKIDVQIKYPEFLPVMGDPSGLGQVIMNLCINACDSMPDGGTLQIEAKQTAKWGEVVITDSGCGMDEETRDNCLSPFFTTKEMGKGTGLGLSTSYGIVKEHGGEIHVSSEPNKGARFKLCIPLAMGRKKKRGGGGLKIIPGNGEKVLIVDDELGILDPMREAVESLGYSAASVASGKEALKKFTSWRADAVLLDRNMPEMDGIACANKLFEIDPGVKIILVSGYNKDGPHGIKELVGDRIKGYLTKPVDVQAMSRLLNRALNE